MYTKFIIHGFEYFLRSNVRTCSNFFKYFLPNFAIFLYDSNNVFMIVWVKVFEFLENPMSSSSIALYLKPGIMLSQQLISCLDNHLNIFYDRIVATLAIFNVFSIIRHIATSLAPLPKGVLVADVTLGSQIPSVSMSAVRTYPDSKCYRSCF